MMEAVPELKFAKYCCFSFILLPLECPFTCAQLKIRIRFEKQPERQKVKALENSNYIGIPKSEFRQDGMNLQGLVSLSF